jgi:primosomal protein N' (replication factor Y)
MFVKVAINLPSIRGTFDYHLPSTLHGHVRPGHLITVPFGKQRVQGVVIDTPEIPEVTKTRAIEDLVDPAPVLTTHQLELAHWLQHQTRSPLIDCLTLMLPPGLSQRADSLYTLVDPGTSTDSPAAERLVALLIRRGPLRGRQIARSLSRLNWRRAADQLVRQGAIERKAILAESRAQPRHVRTAHLAVPPEEIKTVFEDLGRPGMEAAGRRKAVLEMLIEEGEPIEATWLYAECGAKPADLRYLQDRGLITLGEAEVWRDPLSDVDFIPTEAPSLTSDQKAIWAKVREAVHTSPQRGIHPILIHGVTGSGKTEIYLRAVDETLTLGRSAIVLVPEIALTPQTVRRFLARFPKKVGLIHSQLSDGERYDTWRRCREGDLRVIVGARSALFAPLPDIGLIILDESHDTSYKEQGRSPRYHAREAALAYAQMLPAACILGSATPEISTRYRADQGEFDLLTLPNRILSHHTKISRQAKHFGLTSRYQPSEGSASYIDLPPVRIVDMRQELRSGNRSIFSRPLQKALGETLPKNQQAILFLNRRGSSTYVFCRDCGWVVRCPRCEIPLTYHSAQAHLMCHHCGYTRQSPTNCPRCKGTRVKHFGTGTQRVQTELERIYPNIRTLRWDRDVTRGKGAHDVILAQFASHQADVLIGTQMLAKGLDLPLVTLVGVISADVGLNLPEYHAAERTFQILTQVAGRAGRGLLGGRVILQTYQPDHYAIQAASKHDYMAFYEQELRYRKQLGYPPYRRLARLVFRHSASNIAAEEAKRMAARVQELITSGEIIADLIGPSPCFYKRIRGLYRWHIVIRAKDPTLAIPEDLPEGWFIDVDPVTLL